MIGGDLTILVAVAAGLLSFLSPCVLPLVPAYLGQLTAVAIAGGADGAGPAVGGPSRWLAFRHALAYVAGFGSIFTLLGVTATFASAGFSEYLPVLRQVGGVILIILGLNLAGVLRNPWPRTHVAAARCRRSGVIGQRDGDDVARVGRRGGRNRAGAR